VDAGPTGGMAWDGRLNSLHEQARVPLFASHEMGNASAMSLAARLRRSPYAARFRRAFSDPGQDVFDHPEAVVAWVAQALEVYQQDAATFYPFTSKYDAALRGRVRLDDAELRGLGAFEDPNRGNCASCHPSGRRSDGGFPSFTDAGYAALGLPRNRELAANRDPGFFDMGLCGPDRGDLAAQRGVCGMFKTPSLRNVALRGSFFHNGVFHDLREAVAFYATRDIAPARWYPRRADGEVERYDDLPPALRGNVNVEVPFAPWPDGRPRLDDAEVDDIVAFLRTLTDGWKPPAGPGS
jgi:cytochrome c peroxidase